LLAGCRPHGIEALRRGDEALRAGQTEQAISLLEQAVTDLPSESRAWNHLGLAYRAAGRDGEALKAHLRALERNPGFAEAWFNVGLLQFEQGNWLESERALRTCLGNEALRTNAVAWRTLGLAQLESNQIDLAERSLATATRLAPRDVEAWNGVGLTQVARRRHRDALKTFAYIAQVAPEHAPARLNAAVVTHQHMGDRREAIPLYRAYLALNPPNAADVEGLVAQLERSLKPVVVTDAPPPVAGTKAPVRVATNLVSRTTNPPAKLPTNAVPAVVRTGPTNSVATNFARLVRPLATNAPAKPVVVEPPQKPEPEPQVVRVEPEPKLAVARDVKPAPVAAPPRNSPPAAPATNPPAAAVPEIAKVDPATEPEAERGFWQKANPGNWNWRKSNPVSWFGGRGEPSATNRPTPLNQTTTNRASARNTLGLPRATNSVPAAPTVKPKPVVPRRQRQVPDTIAPGNRSAAELKFNEAILAHNRRDFAGAAVLYEQAAQADPSFYPAHHNLALLALDLNEPAKAVTAAEYATTLQPDSTASRQLYAAALQRANFPADAAEQVERLLQANPNDAQCHLTVAGLYASALGETAQARAHYQRVLELEPNHPQAAAIRIWLAGNP
jgi:tetratricopeptide (TPR) repeat protein